MEFNFNIMAFQFLAGGVGGLVRGLVGIYKSYSVNPAVFKFDWKYFAFSLGISMITGQLSGVVFNSDWRSSLLAGYAGSDLLDSLYKIKFTQLIK